MQVETIPQALLWGILYIIMCMIQGDRKKQIILVRHAKAEERRDWKWSDFDRPLTCSWENSNCIVANYLRLIWLKPDRIVASPSARTKGTAVGLAKKFSIPKIDYVDSLYNEETSLDRDPLAIHLGIVRKNKRDGKALMIIGHNNDLSDFAEYLCGEAVPSMKKWAVIVLSVPDWVDWKNIQPGMLKFVYYLTPHFLRLEELV